MKLRLKNEKDKNVDRLSDSDLIQKLCNEYRGVSYQTEFDFNIRQATQLEFEFGKEATEEGNPEDFGFMGGLYIGM